MAAGEAAVAGLLRDEAMHRLADASVRGMALRRGPELEDVHRLAGVHLHVEADPVGHAHGVGRHRGEALGGQGVVKRRRGLHDAPPVGAAAPLLHRLRHRIPVAGTERLPLERQEPVPLEVPKRAVVREDVEPIARPLERAARLVAPVAPLPDVGGENGARSSRVMRRARPSS